MRILLWHVHGAWTTAFVHGSHDYLVPVLPDRGPYGRGRAQTYEWPPGARELTPAQLLDEPVDMVVLQRPEEEELAAVWLGGRRPGRDVPAVYVEHNAPQGRIAQMRHPLADRSDVLLVHVTHFNRLFWDAGSTESTVIEHGIVDPGERYTGELARAVVVINEAGRRGRVTGTDLLPELCDGVAYDLFGMAAEQVGGVGELRQDQLHAEMARRRVYVHPNRWTSLGLSLLEAMHLGLPVVALQTTEAAEAVPPDTGVVSNRLDVLRGALRRLVEDPDEARETGRRARRAALERYGLERFLRDWDLCLIHRA
jgi:glycosyltransferase involved in cell wall biosynthesis